MGTTGTILKGMAVGAGLMYLLDPDRGKRRRAIARDKIAHNVRATERALDVARRDLRNRARGAVVDARNLIRTETVNEDVVVARVRTALGRTISHPHAVHVSCERGRVTLTGSVPENELETLLGRVASIRGVSEVDNRLQVGPSIESPGPTPRNGDERRMRPGTRLLLGAAGLALALRGRSRRGLVGRTMSTLGYGTLMKAATGYGLRQLTGVGAGSDVVELRKTVNVLAPPAKVFSLWRNVENFPRFMSHLESVEDLGDGRSRWTVVGPAGVRADWVAEITREVPDRLIEWRTQDGSAIENEGRVQFLPGRTGGTTIEIQLRYNPVAGALGHAVASLFGTNARQVLNEDMVRLRSLLDEGHSRVNGHDVDIRELQPSPGTVPGTQSS